MADSDALMPSRKPAAQYHHGDLRNALLLEAVKAIGTEGVEKLTLRDVGARLGVSRTALYRHFPDKAALIAAVSAEGFQRLRADLLNAWGTAEGTRRGFDLMGVAYVGFAVAHPSHYRVMFGDYRRLCEGHADLQGAAGSAFEVLVQAITSLQAARLARLDDPMLMAQFVWATVHGIALLAIDGQMGPPPESDERLTALLRYSLVRLRAALDVDPSGAVR